MKKRVLSMLLVLCVVVALLPTTVLAAYNDTNGHWGKDAIEQWTGNGILHGFNGSYRPDDDMTRAELATVIANLLKLTDTNAEPFNDVSADDWYAEAILKCRAADIMLGYPGNTAHPNDPVSREETMVLIGRAFVVKPDKGESTFDDGEAVSEWAADYVNAMTEKKYVKGFPDNTVRPQDNINRASVAALLDQTISKYCNTSGDTVDVHATDERVTLIAAPNVTVTGNVANLVVATGKVEDGQENTVTVESTNVSGGLTVVSANTTVTLKTNTTVASAVLTETAEQSKIVVEETTKVDTLTASAAESKVEVKKDAEVGTLTASAPMAEVSVAGKVETVATTNTAAESKVEVQTGAEVGKVAVAGEKTNVAVAGTVENVTVADTASKTTVETSEGSTITKVDNAAEGTTVTGSGTVENVATSGDNTKIETSGTNVEVAEGTEGTIAGGQKVDGGETINTNPMANYEPTFDGFLNSSIKFINDKIAAYATENKTPTYVTLNTVTPSVGNNNIVAVIEQGQENKTLADVKAAFDRAQIGFSDLQTLRDIATNVTSITVINNNSSENAVLDTQLLVTNINNSMDKAKDQLQSFVDALHLKGINEKTTLGELVTITANEPIRVQGVSLAQNGESFTYEYTITFK